MAEFPKISIVTHYFYRFFQPLASMIYFQELKEISYIW